MPQIPSKNKIVETARYLTKSIKKKRAIFLKDNYFIRKQIKGDKKENIYKYTVGFLNNNFLRILFRI